MPVPKVFTFVGNNQLNKNPEDVFFIFLGILGAGIVIAGFIQAPSQAYYVAGACLLLLNALYFKLTYFIALELILLAGHGAILLGIGQTLQVVLPILLSLQLLIFYLLSGELQNIFHLIGIAGIALLSIGFSYSNVWVFFFGSLAIAIFAFHTVFQGKKVALIWAIMNLLFSLGTAYILIFK